MVANLSKVIRIRILNTIDITTTRADQEITSFGKCHPSYLENDTLRNRQCRYLIVAIFSVDWKISIEIVVELLIYFWLIHHSKIKSC